MQTLVCLFILFTVSGASDYNVNIYYNLDNYKNNHAATERLNLFDLGYHAGELLKMCIFLKNKPENVRVDAYLKYSKDYSDNYTGEKKYETNKTHNYFEISRLLNSTNITIGLNLSTISDFCTSYEIVKAKILARGTYNGVTYKDICLKQEPCIVEVDLTRSKCKETTVNPSSSTERDKKTNEIDTSTEGAKHQSSQSNVLVYVISPVFVTCLTILVIYITVKKYRHRNSQPEVTKELNTYATASEVVYADLSLRHTDSQTPRREESAYARIIGVMKPVT